MDTVNFLSRVLAPGNFICVSFSAGTDNKPNHSRFFSRDELNRAASFIEYMARQNQDVYHCQASFVETHSKGTDKIGKSKLYGERKVENAQNIKTFWIDLDIKRQGDKKTAANSFPDRAAALQWAHDFCAAVKIPQWSMAVSSGFGIHLYWVLEDPMAVGDWLPYGKAWSAALVANGFKGDAGLSGNPVCLLRPPGSFNMKTGAPVPAFVYTKSIRGDAPNQMILDALKPYLPSHLTPTQPGQTAGSMAAALVGPGSNVVSLYQGNTSLPNMNAAAQANISTPVRPVRRFASLLDPDGCEQVRHSLQDHGLNDTRQIWYMGYLTAATFCEDGEDFIHIIGDAHPTYTEADTNTEFARAKTEVAAKGLGWPTCAHFNTHRPSVCAGCKHFDPAKIQKQSPLHFAQPKDDLPEGYRRAHNQIQKFWKGEKGGVWEAILDGDIFDPILDELPRRGFQLAFKHKVVNKVYDVAFNLQDLSPDVAAISKLFVLQHLVVKPGKEGEWRIFLIAFIQKLRNEQRERAIKTDPFGWLTDDTTHVGFAVGGLAFRPDGSEESAPGGDPMILANHIPKGALDPWRAAADFTIKGRPDLQVIIAASFAAPLVRLTGHKGLIMSAWSRESGVGKSSALIVSQGVWGAPGMTMGLNDTHNSVGYKLGQTRALPAFWDEMRVGDDKADEFVQFVFRMAQGKERARMGADMKMRETGEWETLLVACANSPLMDRIYNKTLGTEAGALRVFEYKITHPPMPQDPAATRLIGQASTNYGHAGRIYARYLATNYDNLLKALDAQLKKILLDTGATQSERMYSACMACIIIGAKVAKKLNLVNFDIPAIERFLYGVYGTLKVTRGQNLLVSSTGYNCEEIVSNFMAQFMGRKIITENFPVGNGKAVIKWWPQDRNHVDIHISQQDAILRIDRRLFGLYLEALHLSPSDVIDHVLRTYGGVSHRATIGGGTGYGGGRRVVLDIPLVTPELTPYLHTPDGDDNHPSGMTMAERLKKEQE